MTTKKIPELISRLTQKTFIIAAFLAYALQAVTVIQSYVAFNFRNASYGGFGLYPLKTVVLPLILVGILYFIIGRKSTKLWRIFLSTLLAMVVLVFESFIAMINYDVFRHPLGYANAPATIYSLWFELIPVVVATIVAVVIGVYYGRIEVKKANTSLSLLQKMFIIIMPLAVIGHIVIALVSMWGSQPADANNDYLISNLVGLIVPAIVLVCLYLLMSNIRTKIQRLFIATLYLTICAFVIMSTYSILSISLWWYDITDPSYLTLVPEIVGLLIFGGIVLWHKTKNVL